MLHFLPFIRSSVMKASAALCLNIYMQLQKQNCLDWLAMCWFAKHQKRQQSKKLIKVLRYLWETLKQLFLSFLRLKINFLSLKVNLNFLSLKVNFCRFLNCWFTKDELLQMYFSGMLPVFEEIDCFLGCFPHISSFCVLPPNIPGPGPSRLAENIRRNELYEK